jgi:hypothetical protein
MGLEPGLTLGTRLVPVGEVYLLSGTQEVYSDEAGPDERIVDQWLYDAFVEHFGADEIVVEAEDVGDRLEAYAHFVIDVFKPAGAGGKTMRELFELAGEGDVDLDVFGDLSLPGAAGTVGLLADPDEGPALVPFYDALRGYLERGEGDAEMVRELLVDLIDDPQIPPFVIRRLAAAGPGRFSRLMAEALDEPEFDVERDLDDPLEDFKGDVDLDDLDEEEDDLVFADDLVDVRDLAPDERLVMSTSDGPFPMETTYTWEDAAAGCTRMTLGNRGEPAAFAKVAGAFMVSAMRRANRKDLRRLKAILERRPAPAED